MNLRDGTTRLLIAAMIFAALVAPAAAQFDPADQPPAGAAPAQADSVESLIAALDSDEWAERDRAAIALAAHPDATTEHLADIIKTSELSPEQHKRIISILRERFLKGPRGAIGIQFLVGDARSNSTVIEVVRPNFPAGRLGLLRPGDEIVKADGVPLALAPDQLPPDEQPPGRPLISSRRRLVDFIVSHDPGDVVKLTIRRPIGPPRNLVRPLPIANIPDEPPKPDAQPFEELDVDIPLGSWTELNPGFDSREQMMRAWPIRRQAMGLADFQPRLFESELETDLWKRARYAFRPAPTPMLVRSAGAYPGRLQNYRAQAMMRMVKLQPREQQQAQVPAAINIVAVVPNQPQADPGRGTFADRLAELQDQIRLLDQRLDLPSLSLQERNLLEAEIDDARARLAQLLQQAGEQNAAAPAEQQP